MAALTIGRLPARTVLAGCLLLALAGCTPDNPEPEPNVVVDLIDEDWQHTPGVASDNGGLQVTATDRKSVV